jgi:uncharacterized membrane-anchored protein YitT (DUF2179 family)
MICFRIYTENKNLSQIKKLIREYFHSITIYVAGGAYDSKFEKSVIIEVVEHGDVSSRAQIVRFADELKKLNAQQSVLITYHEVGVEIV